MSEYNALNSFDRSQERPPAAGGSDVPYLNYADTSAASLSPQAARSISEEDEPGWDAGVTDEFFGVDGHGDELRFTSPHGYVEGHLERRPDEELASVLEYTDTAGAPQGDEAELLVEFALGSVAKGASRLVTEASDAASLRVAGDVLGPDNLAFFSTAPYAPVPLEGSYEEILDDLEKGEVAEDIRPDVHEHLRGVRVEADLTSSRLLERLVGIRPSKRQIDR
jgi:hypothetical protein